LGKLLAGALHLTDACTTWPHVLTTLIHSRRAMIKIMRATGFSLTALTECNTTMHKSKMLSADFNMKNGAGGQLF
jgi:hypothetical protein